MFNKIKNFFTQDDKRLRDDRWIFSSMLIGALCSLIAAFNISIEALQLAANPSADLVCNINSVVNCATVALTSFSTVFGFPNSFLGLMVEPIVITVAIAGLAGTKFPKLFMAVAQFFYTLGFIFAYYLFFCGLTVVHAVCPWCLIVTLATTFVFFAMTRYNIRENNLFLSKKVSKAANKFIDKSYDKLILWSLVVFDVVILLACYGEGLFA